MQVEVDGGDDVAAGGERSGERHVAAERQRRREGAGLVQRAVERHVVERIGPVLGVTSTFSVVTLPLRVMLPVICALPVPPLLESVMSTWPAVVT